MKLELNGEPHELAPIEPSRDREDDWTVVDLLEQLDLAGRRVAVAMNDCVIPKSRFAKTRISEGDRVEVIQAVGGG